MGNDWLETRVLRRDLDSNFGDTLRPEEKRLPYARTTKVQCREAPALPYVRPDRYSDPTHNI
jgi:hypothetical protein